MRLTPKLLLISSLLYSSVSILAADVRRTPNAYSKNSFNNHFKVSLESKLIPLQIGRMHSWIASIHTLDGQPVDNASIQISGGMPAHNHGLPTSPAVTAQVGDGSYLIEGVKFSMHGAWFIQLTITAGEMTDNVAFDIDL
jgi:hypothetical protein